MGKLTILALLSVLALAEIVTALRITTTVVEDDNIPEQRSHEQIQTKQQLQHCQTYLREIARRPATRRGQGDRLEQCCNDLRSLDQECRCQGLQQAILHQQQQQQQQTHQGEGFQERLLKEAETLPSKCDTTPRTCSFQRPRWI
ncbi:2S sulfur-rich seed storage protein 1-like [Impatiens glandulifera]|uniref:2S sulfur-rich seed storage protein 1-like n=1 Tax=Impatiens glandulifera TaxID=253017 RepID=UPI001FB16572|nr:2S sulfur-rich seed storage protein 1-like [Impatiens glandulifera]